MNIRNKKLSSLKLQESMNIRKKKFKFTAAGIHVTGRSNLGTRTKICLICKYNVARFSNNILILKDWTHKFFLNEQVFRGGSEEK